MGQNVYNLQTPYNLTCSGCFLGPSHWQEIPELTQNVLKGLCCENTLLGIPQEELVLPLRPVPSANRVWFNSQKTTKSVQLHICFGTAKLASFLKVQVRGGAKEDGLELPFQIYKLLKAAKD